MGESCIEQDAVGFCAFSAAVILRRSRRILTHKFCQKILRCAQDDSFKRLLLRYRTADFCFVSDKGLPCDGGLGPLCTARAAGAVPLLRGKGTKARRAAPLTPRRPYGARLKQQASDTVEHHEAQGVWVCPSVALPYALLWLPKNAPFTQRVFPLQTSLQHKGCLATAIVRIFPDSHPMA